MPGAASAVVPTGRVHRPPDVAGAPGQEGEHLELHEYVSLDGVGLRRLLGNGDVRPAEVEAVARTALARADAELNALAMPLFEPALAHDDSGPFAGVPFVIKDSGPFAHGVPFRLGSRAITAAVTAVDHTLMARFRAAGLVTLGQTTTPELGLSFATEAVRYGPTRNPWNLDRGVGGSSGGAAALVAAGAVPIAHANDAGGSIRVPASCCGVVGLKPSRGRTPCGPLVGEAAFGQLSEFAVTRTVRDAAHLLDAVAGPTVGEKYTLPSPSHCYVGELDAPHEPLRVALTMTPCGQTAVDRQVRDATMAVGRMLEWIGHPVTETAPSIAEDDLVEAAMLTVLATGAAVLTAGPPDPSLLEAVSRKVLQETRASSALDVTTAMAAQHRVTQAVGRFFCDHDLLVTPTLAQLPAHHGTLDYDNEAYTARAWLRRLFAYGPFTTVCNVAGVPAISLPLGQSREGLPIGVQLIAAQGREDLLLRAAAQLEQALPWSGRQPSTAV